MNNMRKFLILNLIVLISIPQFTFAGFSSHLKKGFFGSLGFVTASGLLLTYKNYSLKSDIEKIESINKSFENQQVNFDDKPDKIKKKWSMKGWRTRSQVGQIEIFQSAHELSANIPLVIKCIYDDMENGFIHIIDNKMEKIDFTKLEKPNKDYNLKDESGNNIVSSMGKKVPTIENLRLFENAIDVELKQLEDNKKNFSYSKELERILFEKCEAYLKGKDKNGAAVFPNYNTFLKPINAKVKRNDFENLLINGSKYFSENKDLKNLVIFNFKHLSEIKKLYTTEAAQKLIELDIFDDLLKDISETKVIEAIHKKVKKKFDLKKFMFNEELIKKSVEIEIETYFNWAVKYSRLSALKKIARWMITGKNFEEKPKDEVDSEIAKKKKVVEREMDNIVGKIQKILNRIDRIKDINANPDVDEDFKNDAGAGKLTYVNLERVYMSVQKSWDLIKFYVEEDMVVTKEFKNFSSQMMQALLSELKALYQYAINGNKQFGMGMGGDARFGMGMIMDEDNEKKAPIKMYEQGVLTEEGADKLRRACKSWIMGLQYLQNQAKTFLKMS